MLVGTRRRCKSWARCRVQTIRQPIATLRRLYIHRIRIIHCILIRCSSRPRRFLNYSRSYRIRRVPYRGTLLSFSGIRYEPTLSWTFKWQRPTGATDRSFDRVGRARRDAADLNVSTVFAPPARPANSTASGQTLGLPFSNWRLLVLARG